MLRRIFLSVFWMTMALSWPVYAADEDPADAASLSYVTGTVVSVDWVGSKLVLDTGDDQVIFCFDNDVTVWQDGQWISVNSLQQGDNVTVHYINKKHAGLWAVSITDKQPAL